MTLGTFLRQKRSRIDPSAQLLGTAKRAASRHGKPVSQEELAEAVGVSRVWYAMLENGTALRTSRRMLGALAGALMLDPSERDPSGLHRRKARP